MFVWQLYFKGIHTSITVKGASWPKEIEAMPLGYEMILFFIFMFLGILNFIHHFLHLVICMRKNVCVCLYASSFRSESVMVVSLIRFAFDCFAFVLRMTKQMLRNNEYILPIMSLYGAGGLRGSIFHNVTVCNIMPPSRHSICYGRLKYVLKKVEECTNSTCTVNVH